MQTTTGAEIFITRFSAWAPGVESPGEWDEWALGKRNILCEDKAPDISYTDSSFRRRLSQISKMSIQVIHDLLPLREDAKILFFSFRGELSREYQIHKSMKEDGTLRPAAFSLSGFNTPVALASIAFGLKAGYSALYPADNSFSTCITAAEAALVTGAAEEIVFVYADENVSPGFRSFFREPPAPAAFCMILSRVFLSPGVPLSSLKTEADNPLSFLKRLLTN